MKLWKVVLLVNLAVVVGVGVGYGWWGRDAARLRRELETQRARPATTATSFTARGVVRAVLPDINVLVLTHEDIAGFMPGMTMGFRAASPKLYDGLQVGDDVRFTIAGVPPNVAITAIEKLQ